MNRHFFITSHLQYRWAASKEMEKAILKAIMRFNAKDWGNIPDEDKRANNIDLEQREGHVLGRYETPEGDIYIDMHFGHNGAEDQAVIMFCNEY